jgi:hypothetical protein
MNLPILEHGPFAGLMEKMVSKTNDTSKFDHAKLENRVLADSELDAVSSGFIIQAADVRGNNNGGGRAWWEQAR